jgi:hypothetical protein
VPTGLNNAAVFPSNYPELYFPHKVLINYAKQGSNHLVKAIAVSDMIGTD